MTLADTLGRALALAAESSQGVHFIARGGNARYHSYASIFLRSREVAGGLSEMGVAPGDRVGVAIATGRDFYDAFFGAILAGAVPVSLPLRRRFGPTQDYYESIDQMVRSAGIRLVVSDQPRARDLAPPPSELGEKRLLEIPRCLAAPVRRQPDDLALVQFSSGTTADPKAVALTHRQVLTNIRAIADRVLRSYPERNGYSHRIVSWLPLYHDMGLVGSLMTSLVRQTPLALMSPEQFVARPARWLSTISSFRATISAAPNFAYQMCVDRIRDDELEGVDLSSWRVALDGAETVAASTLQKFHERFDNHGFDKKALTPVYGLAEAGLGVTFSDLESDYRVETLHGHPVVSAGRPLDGFEVRIEGGPVGRVLIRGPSIMSGYLDASGRPGGVSSDGWLDTGDEGFMKDGELYLTGRDRDKLVLRGKVYAPDFFEQALELSLGIASGSVVAVTESTEQGDALVIVVESAGTDPDLSRSIVSTLTERTGIAPGRVLVVNPSALPRTTSGKLRRQEAFRRFVEHA